MARYTNVTPHKNTSAGVGVMLDVLKRDSMDGVWKFLEPAKITLAFVMI